MLPGPLYQWIAAAAMKNMISRVITLGNIDLPYLQVFTLLGWHYLCGGPNSGFPASTYTSCAYLPFCRMRPWRMHLPASHQQRSLKPQQQSQNPPQTSLCLMLLKRQRLLLLPRPTR